MYKKNPRVFIGYSNTSGYSSRLESGFNKIGIKCSFADLGGNKFSYKRDTSNQKKIIKICEYLNQKWRTAKSRKNLFFFLWMILFSVFVPGLFIWSVFNFDVFIHIGHRGLFFNYFDFKILRFLGKKVVKVSLGALTRPNYVDASIIYGTYTGKPLTTKDIVRTTNKQKKLIGFLDRNTDIFVDHSYQAVFHTKDYIALLYLGLPTEIECRKSEVPERNSKHVRILHAASYRGHKGSAQIKELMDDILNELEKDGYNVEYIEISGVSNETVLLEIQKSDFIIDECYSDSPMATFAAEAAYFSKPSVIGGYGAELISEHLPNDLIPPSEFCHPNKLRESIKKLILNADYRKKLGCQAKKYIDEFWSPESVAERFLMVINGTNPVEWTESPYNINYIHGYGLSESKIKDIVGDIIKTYGIKSLQLQDKPHLEKKYLELINSQ